MTVNEKKIMQATEKALRAKAEENIEKAKAATDETIKRVELHRYDIHIFAAVTVHNLIAQLEQ